MNIENTIMNRRCKCIGCKYNSETYGKKIWECTHPIPNEHRKMNEYGCNQGSKKITICEICGKPIHPLDVHLEKCDGNLVSTHIDCWNK